VGIFNEAKNNFINFAYYTGTVRSLCKPVYATDNTNHSTNDASHTPYTNYNSYPNPASTTTTTTNAINSP
jgi:hypothetical protein